MGNFEVRTSSFGWAMHPGGIVRTAGIGMIDLDELASQLNPDLVDPASQFVDTDASRPDPASPTCEPHRYTIHVPTPDHATLSIGKASSDQPWHIPDTGITGRTDSHIHWHTATGATTRSILVLGKGTRDTQDVPTGFKGVPATNTGFAVVTEGLSFIDSRLQSYLVSRTDDVIVRSAGADKVVALQADQGVTEILAGKTAVMAAKGKVAIAATATLQLPDTGYNVTREPADADNIASKIVKSSLAARDIWLSGASILATYRNQTKNPTKDAPGWEPSSSTDKVKLGIDIGKLVSSFAREVDGWAKLSKHLGAASASMYSMGTASMLGDVSASMYGNLSASVTSLLSASVLGGTVSMKGLLYTSIWGQKEVSVKAKKDLKLEGETGKGSLKSELAMSIASTADKLTMQGEKDARLNSVSGKAFLHGAAGVFALGGTGAGYGMGASADGVHCGKFGAAESFKDPKPVLKEGFWVQAKGAGASFRKSKLEFNEDQILLTSPAIKLDAKGDNVTVNGSKILLG